MKKNKHVVPYKKGTKTMWAVKTSGTERPSQVVPKQGDAIKIAMKSAKLNESELFIHKRNGMIRERNSYGKDKFPPKG